ncbi:hypothetical protein I5L78_23720 [Pseudomonas aeruginosa]|nr:hypothetical protein [Pseudomonas aeruginosa]
MSIELNKESVEQADASSCQGTNCGTTTGDHSSECLAEAAAGQGWELKPGDLCGRDCPIHKILVEQAGGDERAAFEAWSGDRFMQDTIHNRTVFGAGYRAALAQPSPAQAEQAEAERPEVVAWQYRVTAGPQTGWSLWHPGKGEEFERSYTVERRPLMTVAQHERITAQLHDALDECDGDRWKLRSERDAANARLHEVATACATAEQERDAALAEVERLRQFERICEGLPQDAIDGGWTVQGIRAHSKQLEEQLKVALARVAELERKLRDEENAHTTTIEQRDNAEHWADQLAKAIAERFGVDIGEHSNLNCPWNEALVWMQQPPAQAQHSVPEEFSFEYRHPNGECHTVTVSREQVINEMPDFLFEALCSKFCNCEPVGETNVVECCCDEYAEEFKLIAAAPGKEVGHE